MLDQVVGIGIIVVERLGGDIQQIVSFHGYAIPFWECEIFKPVRRGHAWILRPDAVFEMKITKVLHIVEINIGMAHKVVRDAFLVLESSALT
jgi:hypothetical protein